MFILDDIIISVVFYLQDSESVAEESPISTEDKQAPQALEEGMYITIGDTCSVQASQALEEGMYFLSPYICLIHIQTDPLLYKMLKLFLFLLC